MMADHFVGIVENGLDLLSGIGNRLDSSMISHRIGTTRRVTVATTGYFEQAGESKKPDDLVDRDCIVYTHLATGNEWHFQGTDGTIKVRVGGCFQTNSSVNGDRSWDDIFDRIFKGSFGSSFNSNIS